YIASDKHVRRTVSVRDCEAHAHVLVWGAELIPSPKTTALAALAKYGIVGRSSGLSKFGLITDIFTQNGWGVVDFHEEIVDRTEFKPQLLGSLGIFEPVYSRSRTIAIADRDRTLSLIPTSEMRAPPAELIPQGAKVRPFNTTR